MSGQTRIEAWRKPAQGGLSCVGYGAHCLDLWREILNSDEIAKFEIILPKDQVSTFQSWLDVRSIGVVFVTLEHY